MHCNTGEPTRFVFVDAESASGFAMEIKPGDFIQEDHVLVFKIGRTCQTWVSLPKNVRPAALNKLLSSFGLCKAFKAPLRSLHVFGNVAGQRMLPNYIEKALIDCAAA